MFDKTKPFCSARRVGTAVILSTILAGCGGGLIAPDPWIEDPGADAFLDRVSKQCAGKTIGGRTLSEMLTAFQNDAQQDYFIDVTTKLYAGRISQEAYTSDIDAFFPRGDNKAGLNCIFDTLAASGKGK